MKMTSNHIPLESITLYRMALRESMNGKHHLSLKYLRTAVMLAPTFTLALCEMGRCHEKLGQYPEALSNYNKVLEIDSSHVEAEIKKNWVLNKIEISKKNN
jgi:tetratricopeptide (TPR) repeat protein